MVLTTFLKSPEAITRQIQSVSVHTKAFTCKQQRNTVCVSVAFIVSQPEDVKSWYVAPKILASTSERIVGISRGIPTGPCRCPIFAVPSWPPAGFAEWRPAEFLVFSPVGLLTLWAAILRGLRLNHRLIWLSAHQY
jgi:hypothetical protein